MKIFYTFVLTLSVFFHCIGCSSHSGRNLHSDSKNGPSPPEKQHESNNTSPEEPPLRGRSRSPASRPSSFEVLGYSLEQLGYMRLIPHTNQELRFEFRWYIFPAGQPITLRIDGKKFIPVPDSKHIVLSSSNGDIFAILENGGFLRGIYRRKRSYPRIRINMISGAITDLSPEEIRDCPLGKHRPIFPHNFVKAFARTDSLNPELHSDSEYDPGSSSARQHPLVRPRSISPPGGPPSVGVLGYTMEELGYVRLIPSKNKRQQFEFRRYIFPTDKSIRMIIDNISYWFGPTREYIVLSTPNGDVFAILDHSGTLRGIYTKDNTRLRVKINMVSGDVNYMTQDEITDCQVGKNYPIFPKRFIRGFSSHNSLHTEHDSNGEHDSITSPVKPQSPDLTSLQEPTVDTRSSSPPGRPPSHEVLGIPLARLGYVRLIPEMNPVRQFEFRKYVFSPHRAIHLLTGYNKYVLMPIREYIVLSTSSGDVFAILEYTGILRGIYKANRAYNTGFSRIRMNMLNGEVSKMSEFEIKECHVGNTYPIFPRWFNMIVSDEDSLQYVYH